jgi:hypothetical protein
MGSGHCEDRAEYLKTTKEHDNGTDRCKVVLLPVILTTGPIQQACRWV